MSSIAGVVVTGQRETAAALADPIVAAVRHQTADNVAVWCDARALLVRLPHVSTPEAKGDRQPSAGHASGRVICFDGRLDNRPELLAMLGAQGAPLKRAPDSEILLSLVQRFGDACLSHLVGDYAFAVWDKDTRRLFCARSPIGWRPLHWSFDGSRFGFATEARTLVVGLEINRRLNEGLVGELLSARIVSTTETLWRDVHRLEQGCSLTFERGEVRIRRWHDERYEDLSRHSDRDHIDRFNHLFDQALVSLSRSHTPIAAHLSGGLDSSAIVCRATELHRSGRISRQVAAVSVRYPGEPHDESGWSSAVEQHLGIEARIARDLTYDFDAARSWCGTTLQLPVRPNTLGPMLSVCAAMRERGERVLLTGEGGDDWLNGSHAHWPDLLLAGRVGKLFREGFAPGADTDLRGFASKTLGPILSARRRRSSCHPNLPLDCRTPAWIRSDWAREIQLRDRWAAVPLTALPGFAQRQRHSMIASPYRQMIFDPILAMVARYGVELRHPFHDLRLVRFLIGARGDMLRRGSERKHLLREAMRGTLPEPVRTRHDKAHFSAPIIDALSVFFAERHPADLAVAREGWVDGVLLGRLFDELRQWRTCGLQGASPNGALAGLWFAVALELWLGNAFKA